MINNKIWIYELIFDRILGSNNSVADIFIEMKIAKHPWLIFAASHLPEKY